MKEIFTKIQSKQNMILKILTSINKKMFGVESSVIFKFTITVFRLWKTRGYTSMIKYMKATRLHITRYIAGKPLMSNKDGVSLVKGFPTKFLYLKDLIDSNELWKLRLVLTLLSLTRGLTPIKGEKVKGPDYSTITEPNKGRKSYNIPKWFIRRWLHHNHLRIKNLEALTSNHYISLKGGPSGKSTISAHKTILNYSYPLMQDLLNFIGNKSFREIFENFYSVLFNNPELQDKNNNGELGKLSIIDDPEGKKRIIAMVDYHSQLSLKSLHVSLLKLLKKLPCDRTYTQDPYHNWNVNSEEFFSLDLTAATDRFPISQQVKLLEVLIGESAAQAWGNLLINRNYLTPEGDHLRYAVGQPMGAYSSWATFTLTHHLVVAWAAYLSGKVNFRQYIILGDDIVIKDWLVAQKYIGLMKRFGVEISQPKTHVSKDTYEFAKRWIKGGVEISGLPLKGILNNINHLRIVLTTLYDYNIKCPNLVGSTVLDIMGDIYHNLKIGKRRYSSRTILKLMTKFYHLYRISLHHATPIEIREFISSFFSKADEDIILPSDQVMPQFLEGLITDGLASVASKTSNEITSFFKKFKGYYNDDLDLMNKFISSPIGWGCLNSIIRVKDALQNYKEKNINLEEAISLVTFESMDKIARKDRNKKIYLDNLDSIFTKSLKLWCKPKDEWYLMLNPHHADVTPISPWERVFITNSEFLISELKDYVGGKLQKPKVRTQEEIMAEMMKAFGM